MNAGKESAPALIILFMWIAKNTGALHANFVRRKVCVLRAVAKMRRYVLKHSGI